MTMLSLLYLVFAHFADAYLLTRFLYLSAFFWFNSLLAACDPFWRTRRASGHGDGASS